MPEPIDQFGRTAAEREALFAATHAHQAHYNELRRHGDSAPNLSGPMATSDPLRVANTAGSATGGESHLAPSSPLAIYGWLASMPWLVGAYFWLTVAEGVATKTEFGSVAAATLPGAAGRSTVAADRRSTTLASARSACADGPPPVARAGRGAAGHRPTIEGKSSPLPMTRWGCEAPARRSSSQSRRSDSDRRGSWLLVPGFGQCIVTQPGGCLHEKTRAGGDIPGSAAWDAGTSRKQV